MSVSELMNYASMLGRCGWLGLVVACVACAGRPAAPPPPSRETALPEEVAAKTAALRGRLEELRHCLHTSATIDEPSPNVLVMSADAEETAIVERRFPCPGPEAEPLYWIDPATLPRASGFIVMIGVAASIFRYAESRHWESPCAHDYGDSRGRIKSETGVLVEVLRMVPKPAGRPPFAGVTLLHGSSLATSFEEDVRAAIYGEGPVRCGADRN
jgi:hypothetical protein